MLSYLFNKGWRFKGERMSDETFDLVSISFNDIKNVPVYDSINKQLVLMRGKQLAIIIDMKGTEADWIITKPNVYLPFTVDQVSIIKKWKKASRSI
jgi:hypothetical protein